MKCFSTELLSDLGSVKYIFSDKTGTLTKNETQFKACSIFTYLFDENDSYDDNGNLISKSEINSLFTTNNYSKKMSTASKSNFSVNFDANNILKRCLIVVITKAPPRLLLLQGLSNYVYAVQIRVITCECQAPSWQ